MGLGKSTLLDLKACNHPRGHYHYYHSVTSQETEAHPERERERDHMASELQSCNLNPILSDVGASRYGYLEIHLE